MPHHVILPGTGKELLRKELALAFAREGCRVTEANPSSLLDPASPGRLEELFDGTPPLLFSVNFQGLARPRPVLELMQKAGGKVAVWCVDNPWSLLSGVRDPFWKKLSLFVTDASFIAPLQRHGAERVFHLPLAACPELFAPSPLRDAAFPPPPDLAPFVFVGRSAFPGKDAFFSGQAVPEELLSESRAMLRQGKRPDLVWWERRLDCGDTAFWPGKKARQPAFGAEEANLSWRGMCVAAAAGAAMAWKDNSTGPALDVFGDEGWQGKLPAGARLRPPVDYYARLPGIYAAARFSLCLTSLQLPQGLNQRHFDVWTAGGVCLSDATPGLSIFPQELTRPITFSRASEIGLVAERLERDHDRMRLGADWRAHLWEHHTYTHRVRAVLEQTGCARRTGSI